MDLDAFYSEFKRLKARVEALAAPSTYASVSEAPATVSLGVPEELTKGLSDISAGINHLVEEVTSLTDRMDKIEARLNAQVPSAPVSPPAGGDPNQPAQPEPGAA